MIANDAALLCWWAMNITTPRSKEAILLSEDANDSKKLS